jgi:hypothetical protein
LGRVRPSGMRSQILLSLLRCALVFSVGVLLAFGPRSALAGGTVALGNGYTTANVWRTTSQWPDPLTAPTMAELVQKACDAYSSLTVSSGHYTCRATRVTGALTGSFDRGYWYDPWAAWYETVTYPVNASAYSACPANSTASGSSCTCNTGYSANLAGTACDVTNACSSEAGKLITTNYTVGWVLNPKYQPVDAVSNTVGDYLGPALNSYQCVAGCRRYIDGLKDGPQGFVSSEPSGSGLYRLSLDFVTVGQGTTCTTPTNDPSNPNAPNPACPGTIGEVNGQTRCLPKSGGPAIPPPSNTASAPPPGVPITPGNPAAGDKPSSGSGAGSGGGGRTPTVGGGGTNSNPSSGGGGNSGGSSSAAGGGTSGGVGAGTTSGGAASGAAAGDKPEANCGAPNQPKCKIDETGTPDGQAEVGQRNTAFDQAVASSKTQIDESGGKVTGLPWTWSFTFPTASCTAFHWGKNAAYLVDPCNNEWVNRLRAVIAYLFYGLAGFYMWRSVVGSAPGAK